MGQSNASNLIVRILNEVDSRISETIKGESSSTGRITNLQYALIFGLALQLNSTIAGCFRDGVFNFRNPGRLQRISGNAVEIDQITNLDFAVGGRKVFNGYTAEIDQPELPSLTALKMGIP